MSFIALSAPVVCSNPRGLPVSAFFAGVSAHRASPAVTPVTAAVDSPRYAVGAGSNSLGPRRTPRMAPAAAPAHVSPIPPVVRAHGRTHSYTDTRIHTCTATQLHRYTATQLPQDRTTAAHYTASYSFTCIQAVACTVALPLSASHSCFVVRPSVLSLALSPFS